MTSQNYLVYKLTSPNGKSYIGRTKNYLKRCNDHKNGNKCRLLQDAIKEFGWHHFNHEILKDGLTLHQANLLEEFYIDFYQTLEPNGYNSQTGGIKTKFSEASKKRISDSHKGQIAWNKGKKLTPEHREKLRLSHLGKKQSKETVEKRVSKFRGKPRARIVVENLRCANVKDIQA